MTKLDSNRQKIRLQNKFGKAKGKDVWKSWLKEMQTTDNKQ